MGLVGLLRHFAQGLGGHWRNGHRLRRGQLGLGCGEVGGEAFERTDHSAEGHVTIYIEGCMARLVVGPGKSQGVGCGILAQTGRLAQNVAAQGLARKHHRLELVEDQFGGRILITVDFIAYYLYLLVYLRLRVDTVEHDVGEQVGGTGEVGLQHRGIVHGLLFGGKGVEVSAHPFEPVGYVACTAACRALEGEMFDEVGHARVGLGLMTRSGTDHIAAIHDLRMGGFVEDAQPVGESICLVGHGVMG